VKRAYIDTPADTCLAGMLPHAQTYLASTDQQGRFSYPIDPPQRGDGIQVAFFTPDWQRFYTQVHRFLLQIYVHTDRLAGRATPFTALRLVLADAASSVRAQATTSSDERGAFDIRLRDPDNAPVTIVPGDRVTLEADDGTAKVPVEELTFDFSTSTGLLGRTAPKRSLHATLGFASGVQADMAMQSDDRGRFGFTPADVPARTPWRLADAQRLHVVLPTTGGHEIVSEAVLVAQHPDQQRLYLPWTTVPRIRTP
jgi:hypothetical protein